MNKKIMIVDDDRDFLEELRETLVLSGYDLVAVNDVHSVVSIAKREKPALILLDLKMPEKSGFEIADELKRFSELSHIPIIAMSGFFKEGYDLLMRISGIKEFIPKPFNALDVINRIETELVKD